MNSQQNVKLLNLYVLWARLGQFPGCRRPGREPPNHYKRNVWAFPGCPWAHGSLRACPRASQSVLERFRSFPGPPWSFQESPLTPPSRSQRPPRTPGNAPKRMQMPKCLYWGSGWKADNLPNPLHERGLLSLNDALIPINTKTSESQIQHSLHQPLHQSRLASLNDALMPAVT